MYPPILSSLLSKKGRQEANNQLNILYSSFYTVIQYGTIFKATLTALGWSNGETIHTY